MSLLSRWFHKSKAVRSGTSNPSQWLIDWVSGGQATSSGVNVTESSALKYTPFWAAVRVISATVASLPFLVYERTGAGKKRTMDHPVYRLLHDRPNPYMDALTFMESRQGHVLTYGNGYAEIQRDGTGRPIALWPLLPDRVERKVAPDKTLYYEVKLGPGQTALLRDEDVLHIKGLGFDGYTGYNVVAYHKEAIGYGVGVKEFAGRFFAQGAHAGGVLEHPNALGDKAYDRLQKWLATEKSGLTNAHRMAILEEGMKWSKTGVDPEQAQALETQKYTVDDCSRIFNIPPHKLGSLDRATFTNIEEQNIDFVTSTMFYWFRKWEQEVNYKLFLPATDSRFFAEILVDALLRGNMAARSAAYGMGRQWGWLSVNDIRRAENLNEIGPDGDIYLQPINMKPAGTPNPAPVPPADDDPSDRVHFQMIAEQWRRIAVRVVNSSKRQVTDEAWSAKEQDWAQKILKTPVIAWATSRSIPASDAVSRMETYISQRLQPPCQIAVDDAADLAVGMMHEIGGYHARQ